VKSAKSIVVREVLTTEGRGHKVIREEEKKRNKEAIEWGGHEPKILFF